MEQDNNSNKVERLISEITKDFLEKYGAYYLDYSKTILDKEDDIPHFLLRRLEEMKSILIHLNLAWKDTTPMVHQGFMLYAEGHTGKNERKKLINYSTNLINSMTFFAQNTKVIHNLLLFYDNQIKDLKAMIGEPNNTEE